MSKKNVLKAFLISHSIVNMPVMYRQHPPPPAYHGHLTPLLSREEGIWLSESSSRGWGIWTAPSISREIPGVASHHGGRGVRGLSWKRLCLCGQLVTRKGLKQALCRIWRYLNFNIFNIGFRLWIYECIKLSVYYEIQYLYRQLNTTIKSSTEVNYFDLPHVYVN